MIQAEIDGRLVKAGPDSPDVATCPACGGEVHRRRRRGRNGKVTYFYRHKTGIGDGCSLRYRPVEQ
jgi:hypothetical protein